MAGLALAKTRQHDGIRRELAPVGHLFIPVFFLQIGIDADIGAFGHVAVLRDAAVLLVIAVVGKLVASFGLFGTRADRWLVGLGMLPRGEVGLIFATIGLTNGVLGQDLYASLLLVVLITTLATPQLLKLRFGRVRSAISPGTVGGLPMTFEPPQGGWLRIVDGQVRLAATPPPDRALTVALDAAVEMTDARPSPELLDYLSNASGDAVWNDKSTASLRKVVERGSARSWRFLETVGVLDRALPELAQTMRARYADPLMLDASRMHQWGALERIRDFAPGSPLRAQYDRLQHPEWLLLAALLVEGLEGHKNVSLAAAGIVKRVGFGPAAESEVVGLVEDDGLLRAAAARVDAFDEEEVLQLASHLDTPERARASYLLAAARDDSLEVWEFERLSSLHEVVQRALADGELTGVEARNLIERRRTEAMLLARDRPDVVERIRYAPRSYVARQQAGAIVRHALLTEPPLRPNAVRVEVTEAEDAKWLVEVGAKDRPGLMAAVTGVLARSDLDVDRAVVATWGDSAAIESFIVSSTTMPVAEELSSLIEKALDQPLEVQGVPGAEVTFDDLASPWHTVVEVHAPEMPGLLHAVSGVFAAASVEIRAAGIGHSGSKIVDRFEVVGMDGPRLSDNERRLIRTYLASGVRSRQRRFRRGYIVEAASGR